jgi:hypothetical protein
MIVILQKNVQEKSIKYRSKIGKGIRKYDNKSCQLHTLAVLL